ncbi:MAG: TFIIB-type zinc ribbon-containing protein [Halanaeroarchaeum sp.]
MQIRGERTCTECGTTWSYFETGSVACPQCGSVLSTGRGNRTQHTDRAADLDLGEARARAAEESLEEALSSAAQACLSYVRQKGFVDEGSLRELDDDYVYAQELRHTAVLARSFLELDSSEEAYLLGMLHGPPDDRPGPAEAPERLRPGRALGVASAVRDYRDDVRAWLEGRTADADGRKRLETLSEHRKRVHALDGEVPPSTAEDLLNAARAVGRYYRNGDDASLDEADRALERLR